MPIDPSEPTYCYCEQVSYGEVSFPRGLAVALDSLTNAAQMIGCDNDACRREWFHLACTLLDKTPDGEWFCDDCIAAAAAHGVKRAPSPKKKKYRRR